LIIKGDLVPRLREVENINAEMKQELTIVNAPTGINKPDLLAEWVDQTNSSMGWIPLDIFIYALFES